MPIEGDDTGSAAALQVDPSGLFCYDEFMDIRFNPQNNGACPLCTKMEECVIRKGFSASVKAMRDSSRSGMEMVIYSCPMFKERF
jgi:hypothetical protein